MPRTVELTGITWNHSRALPPLVATAQRYEELHPGVRISWEKRSLDEFGHMPVDILARRFDLIVIDHPWAGFCFARDLTHDLKPLLDATQWNDLENHSIGPSFSSYHYGGRLLAIPIDAATPAPSCRDDLLAKRGKKAPSTWNELVRHADSGLVVMPGFPADLFLNWLMLAEALGGKPFSEKERIADPSAGIEAMDMLRRLSEKMPRSIFEWNPILIAELMTSTDHFPICAFAYGYNNYCRPSFVRHPLKYKRLPTLDDGTVLRSVVGGTGIAISKSCKDLPYALDYSLFTGSSSVQSGIYLHAGGQPSRREAWQDSDGDTLVGGFFSATRQDQENALLRPRYDGYVRLQEELGVPLAACLKGEIGRNAAWQKMNTSYLANPIHHRDD